MNASVQRLLRPWAEGEACVSRMSIYYARDDIEIAEGRQGTVRAKSTGGSVLVHWHGFIEGLSFETTADALDPIVVCTCGSHVIVESPDEGDCEADETLCPRCGAVVTDPARVRL